MNYIKIDMPLIRALSKQSERAIKISKEMRERYSNDISVRLWVDIQ